MKIKHSTGSTASKSSAQLRADRIAAFRAELDKLITQGILTLSEQQRRAIDQYHAVLLEELIERFDIDADKPLTQLLAVPKNVSLLKLVALSTSIFSVVYLFWERIASPLQVALLAAVPILGLLAIAFLVLAGGLPRRRHRSARREAGRSGYESQGAQ